MLRFVLNSLLIALFALARAEGADVTFPTYYIRKQVDYVQTSQTAVSARGTHIYVLKDRNLPYTVGLNFTGKLESAGVTYSLVIETDPYYSVYAWDRGYWYEFAFDKAYGSVDELERAFPTNTNAKITTTWPRGQKEDLVYISSAKPPPAAPITNFDAVQNWDGGPLKLFWKLPRLASFALGQNPSDLDVSNQPFTLKIYRAADIDSLAQGVVLASIFSAFAEDNITFDIKAAPGETLYGEFTATVVGEVGSFRFPIRRAPAVVLPPLPTITTQPMSTTVRAGEKADLAISATGSTLSFQWKKNGAAIPGATDATIHFNSTSSSDAGSYVVVVSNPAGQVTSDAATLTVLTPPVVTNPPVAQSVPAGAKTIFSVTANGTAPFTYQWLRNGTAIAGATQSTFTLDHPHPSDSGQYSVTITNSAGSVTSAPADVRINPVSRISNLSILTSLDSASDNFTLGFVVRGNSSGGKPVLMRAVGPSLAALGVAGALEDPKLELLDGATVTLANDNWGGAATLSDAFRASGAFGFANPTSKDAASLTRVNTPNNSIRISGTGSGLVLAELYDATLADDFEIASPRFANVSVLKNIGGGLTAGFVIDGTEPVRLLVRAIGPALAGFGVAGIVADPKLDLFQGGSTTAIYSNDNWGTAATSTEIATAAARVGAFALAQDSKDAVLLVTLPPGSYTAQVTGVNNSTGTALVEVYEVP